MQFICPSIKTYLETCGGNKSLDVLTRRGHSDVLNLDYVFVANISRDCSHGYDLGAILDYVLMAAEWVGRLKWSTPVRRLSVTLWLSPMKKVWCPVAQGVNLIGKCEVNSGETHFVSGDRRNISVWRAEDWSKVVLHELFHAFNWDRLVPSTRDNQSEALVETMAILTHCQLLGGPNGWRELLAVEQQWMWQQVLTLFRHPWKPVQTSVHSYYVLKCALIMALPVFSAWLKQPSETACADSWPQLVELVLKQLHAARITHSGQPSTASVSPPQCISLRMSFHQLSLQPKNLSR